MELILLLMVITLLLIMSAILYSIINNRRLLRYQASLKPGIKLHNQNIKLLDPYYENGMDTCVIRKVSEMYALVEFYDEHRTKVSIPIRHLYENMWEIRGYEPFSDYCLNEG